MTSRRASSNKSTVGVPTPRNRLKPPSPDVEHGTEPWTVAESVPTEFPAMNFVYRRGAEPARRMVKVTIYVAGDDASRGLQYRACLRRAQVVTWDVPTPSLFEDGTARFSGLEALVRDLAARSILIFSSMARRTAGDRIEAMKLALADRDVEVIEVPEWYRGFAELRRAARTSASRSRPRPLSLLTAPTRADAEAVGPASAAVVDVRKTKKLAERAQPKKKRKKKP